MECLNGLIAVQALCNPQDKDTTKRYIDALPGLDMNVLSNWANLSKDETPDEVVQSKLDFTAKEAWHEILWYLNKHYKLTVNSLLCTDRFGILESKKSLTPNIIDRGVYITPHKYQHSQYTSIKIDEIRIFSENNGQLTLTIEDGPIINTYTKDVQSGINTWYPDYISQYNDMKVYVNSDNLILMEMNLPHSNPCNDCNKRYCHNITAINNNPLEIQVSTFCNIEKMMCNMKYEIQDVLLYYTAIEITKEGLYSSRLNADTLNVAKIDKLLAQFQESYDRKLQAVAESLYNYMKNLDKYCVECKGNRHMNFRGGGRDNFQSYNTRNV